jgi:hypothetical protein
MGIDRTIKASTPSRHFEPGRELRGYAATLRQAVAIMAVQAFGNERLAVNQALSRTKKPRN